MEKYLTKNPDLKDVLNGIEVEKADGAVPKRPAMDDSAKETAKVHPEDDCNISIRAADSTTCVEEMNEQKNDLLPLEVDTTKNDEGPVMHKKGARGSRRPSSDVIEPWVIQHGTERHSR